jgi:lipopolysaccharide/colanic/teichoic acid biosynthesis glycosyltransferase
MRSFIKRSFDLLLSFVSLLILSPVFIIVSVIIKFKMSDGPVFFVHKRIGQYGHLFNMIKFRTMVTSHSGVSVSVKGESRITSVGAVLRKFKIDELPELVNVLLGQMSFVGPRPDVPGFADKLVGEDRKILELKPGITGPATIIFANEEELLASISDPIKYNDEIIFPEKIKINMEYYYNNSFFGDLRIILKTIFSKSNKTK